LRALIIPWGAGSILFVGISSALLAFFQGKGVLGAIGSFFLLSWFFKYAYVLLESVAHGRVDAPVVAVEMLGPFEQRPLIQLAWCTVGYLAVRWLGGTAGIAAAALLLVVLPASVAALGLGLGIWQSVNPRTLWQILRGLAWQYLGVLALIAVASALIVVMVRSGVWTLWTIAVAEIAVLTMFSALGGALFERRLEIGHEPVSSPERQREKYDREHARELSAMLDELYAQMRVKRHEDALEPLLRWFPAASEDYRVADVHTIVDRVAGWRNAAILSLVTQTLVVELTRLGEPDLARDAQRYALLRGASPGNER
jgi:hypothetical protein